MRKSNALSKILSIFVVTSMILSGLSLPWSGVTQEAYAKTIGEKNKQACDHCKDILNNVPPELDGDEYESVLGNDKSVYRGGHSNSGLQGSSASWDNDPNDFSRVLPYGNTYVDASKLTWSEATSGKFTIDIPEGSPFKWVGGTDKAGIKAKNAEGTLFSPDSNPMGEGRGLPADRSPIIAYVGKLNGYLDDLDSDEDDKNYYLKNSTENGNQNEIKASAGSYLYKIIYEDAVTLQDGTKGNLVITVDKVVIETTLSSDKALITIQNANSMSLSASQKDADGNFINQQDYVAKTAEEVKAAMNGNDAWDNGNPDDPEDSGYNKDKNARAATGAIVDLDIKVTDAAGNPVKGTISYAASDLDFENFQDLWGRKITSDSRFMFNEGLTIQSGAQSYAVTPFYNHADGTTVEKVTGGDPGWIPVGPDDVGFIDPATSQLVSPVSPLVISGNGSDGKANGVRFSGTPIRIIRDKNGSFDNVLFGAGDNLIVSSGQAVTGASKFTNKDLDKNTVHEVVKRQLNGIDINGDGAPDDWDKMTNADVLKYLGMGSIATQRNDAGDSDKAGKSFDTGFALLLDASGSKMQWSASNHNGGTVGTSLFDTTIYTYVEQSHGTGGGIYLETYDLSNECTPYRAEGIATMAKGSNATVTTVPEDGYRVDTIMIGKEGLADPTTYTMVYGDDGSITAIKDEDGISHALVNNKVTIDGIEFEANVGGSVDVSMESLQKPHHVHVDFTADYYFYKVWKGKKDPENLKMTATPYAFVFQEVTLEDGKYTIKGNTYTAPDGTEYELENNYFKVGEGADAITYFLEGNSLVTYKYNEETQEREKDKSYPIRLDYVQNGDPVKFTVSKTDADDATETNVAKATEDGYTIWKITYPAEGYTTKNEDEWPSLPIETEPTAHNINHVERNYWFVTEEVTGWSLESYDNSKAEAPGKIDTATSREEVYKEGDEGDLSAWAFASTKDYTQATAVIKNDVDNDQAFMSVFNSDDDNNYSWGGKIVNVSAVVVNVEKTWDDLSNVYNTRQDVWFHIDAKASVGSGNEIKDILPPQKLAPGTVNTEKLTWGLKSAYGDDYLADYNGDDYSKTKVVGKASDIPRTDSNGNPLYYAQDESNPHKYLPKKVNGLDEDGNPVYSDDPDGITYYVNELADGMTYHIRETDGEGTELDESDDSKFLTGYKTEIADDGKATKDTSPVVVDGIKTDSYTNKVKNTLELTDFTVTKIWKENGADRTHTLEADVAKLKEAFTLNENDEVWPDTAGPKLQPSDAEEYVPASGGASESGTLETKNGTDETEIVFTWHNVPKYIGDTDDDGNPIVRETEFSIVESALNGYEAPQYSDDDKAPHEGTITNKVLPPEGKPKETWGEKNKPQTANGTKMFNVTTETDVDGNPNKIEKVELIDPSTGNPTVTVKVEGGMYTIDENGIITFMPDEDFVGDPPAVTVRGTDSNGLAAETTYTPHVVETTKKVTRTIEYFYDNGDSVIDKSTGEPLKVVQVVEFAGTLNPETGEVIYPENAEGTMDEVPSGDINGYNVDKKKVGEAVVYPSSNDLYEKVIYSPKGVIATADVTYGLPNEPQTGTPTFEMETPTYTDGTPNELTIKLIDPYTGEPVDDKTVDAVDENNNKVGTYTLNDDGTVMFTPNKDYVGNPKPLELQGTDRFGSIAKTTYTPHIVNPEITDTASRNIYYTYETKDGKEVTGSDKQTVTIRKHPKEVDPKTGEVLKWGDWEPTKFPALKNPDDKVDGRIWFTEDSVDEQIVTEPGEKEDVHVVYQKIPYTVKYLDGKHGKSDGKGNQSGENYGNDVTGGNGVKPAKGYHFTGKYTYVIKDHYGKVIGTGETDDPTSINVTGNIEFTPQYAPNKYTIKYDANGGSGTMTDQNFTGKDSSAKSKDNEFTRKGHQFVGFKAKLLDGSYLKDKNGKVLIFKNPDEFIEHLHKIGDGAVITLEAQWKKLPTAIYVDPATGRTIQRTLPFLDENTEPDPPADPTRDGYKFVGWERIEEYDENGDLVNVRYEAKWEKIEETTVEPTEDPGDSSGSTKTKKGANTGDDTYILMDIAVLLSAALAMFLMIRRRRKYNR